MPALALSLLFIAAGAVLAFAVETSVSGFDLYAAGVILMIVGVIGMVLSLLFWVSFAPFGRHEVHEETHLH